ncbi:hypothetical protein J416_12664 [Gracilibacillus halophilus YIM-C55.5]|uniref:VanZ-like domain-containing protein n=1 Tax=Gracilibacillus halophilus YIM-C55.5 TaxID=1308866 RepID=N4WSD1_9BACI|nr:VanZ family protein [Gracilibacillus halophilus]ENH96056.1 hypothetical protein J416_12664 [Gracilibacillus halophilus YIM-C55.5]
MGEKTKKIIRVIFSISFIFYVFILLRLLFLSRVSGIGTTDLSLLESIRINSNFIPFKTINTYLQAIFDNSMNMGIPIKNLFGNLFMFLPMGIYLPFFFKSVHQWRKFTLLMIVILLFVEILQLFTGRGSFDIDDFILNMVGAYIGFGIWKVKFVRSTLN